MFASEPGNEVDNRDSTNVDVLNVNVTKDGPLLIKGEIMINNTDGSSEMRSGNTALCRCGASGNKPFCDGSHKRAGFQG